MYAVWSGTPSTQTSRQKFRTTHVITRKLSSLSLFVANATRRDGSFVCQNSGGARAGAKRSAPLRPFHVASAVSQRRNRHQRFLSGPANAGGRGEGNQKSHLPCPQSGPGSSDAPATQRTERRKQLKHSLIG